MYLKNISIPFVLIIVLFTACKNEKPTDSAERISANEKQSHPAKQQKAQAKNNTYKITAMGESGAEQVRKQDALRQREQLANHLNTGGLHWTTFEGLAKEDNSEKKKYLIDVYTDWCGWCKVMDKKTFTDPEIQEYLRENFHIVKFNAEQRDKVPFKGKEYEWINGGRRGINRLAIELLGERMSYPTIVYLDENMNKITAAPGYKKPDQLMQELKAIVEGNS